MNNKVAIFEDNPRVLRAVCDYLRIVGNYCVTGFGTEEDLLKMSEVEADVAFIHLGYEVKKSEKMETVETIIKSLPKKTRRVLFSGHELGDISDQVILLKGDHYIKLPVRANKWDEYASFGKVTDEEVECRGVSFRFEGSIILPGTESLPVRGSEAYSNSDSYFKREREV